MPPLSHGIIVEILLGDFIEGGALWRELQLSEPVMMLVIHCEGGGLYEGKKIKHITMCSW